jgi:hypothetical protein
MKEIINILNLTTYRYEKKYVISVLNENKFFFHLNKHPFLFEKSYDDRYVNNIYFDTPSMNSYWDNVIGLSKRIKVRIRWYGDARGYIQCPILELKIRNNALGSKVSYRLGEILIDSNLTIKSIQEQFMKLDAPLPIKEFLLSLRMTLMNRYSRKYFVTKDQNFRLTYDSELQFTAINNYGNSFNNKINSEKRRVFEVKYDQSLIGKAPEISNYFPFRMTKSSKYVFGIDKLKS